MEYPGNFYKEKYPKAKIDLGEGEIKSIVYHSLFEYPLKLHELVKWQIGPKSEIGNQKPNIKHKGNFFYVEGSEGTIYKRIMRARISKRKLKTAKYAARTIALLPTVKMVGVTGSLAMANASDDSDIDLIIITSNKTLWTTRLFTYALLKIFRIKVRKVNRGDERDKVCLNIWLDEEDLTWPKESRNVYTAHEIGQIVPLINKKFTHENFINKNQWIKDYWPNAVSLKKDTQATLQKSLLMPIEPIARAFQLFYMRKKVTREVISPTRALFHPIDWSEQILSRLS